MPQDASNREFEARHTSTVLVLNQFQIKRLAELSQQHPAKTEIHIGFLTHATSTGLHAWFSDLPIHQAVPLFDAAGAALRRISPVGSAK